MNEFGLTRACSAGGASSAGRVAGKPAARVAHAVVEVLERDAFRQAVAMQQHHVLRMRFKRRAVAPEKMQYRQPCSLDEPAHPGACTVLRDPVRDERPAVRIHVRDRGGGQGGFAPGQVPVHAFSPDAGQCAVLSRDRRAGHIRDARNLLEQDWAHERLRPVGPGRDVLEPVAHRRSVAHGMRREQARRRGVDEIHRKLE